MEQLNRPLTPSSCGQPSASDPRTPVSHGETDGDDLYDTPLFVLAQATPSVAMTGTDAFDVSPGEGINLGHHLNGNDEEDSVDNDATVGRADEKAHAVSLLKHHPFRNIVRKGKWKGVTQQQCNAHRQLLFEYITKLVDLPHCFDGINRCFSTCACLKSIQEGTIEAISNALGKNFMVVA